MADTYAVIGWERDGGCYGKAFGPYVGKDEAEALADDLNSCVVTAEGGEWMCWEVVPVVRPPGRVIESSAGTSAELVASRG